MDPAYVQRRTQRSMSDRMLERYPMSNSDLYSSDSSCDDDDISDLVYRNWRLKAPVKLPFRVENFVTDESVTISRRPSDIRPQSIANCVKCNQIRTNPRFRPSSFHSYGKFVPEQKAALCVADDDESSDDQIEMNQQTFPKNRRRTRHKPTTR